MTEVANDILEYIPEPDVIVETAKGNKIPVSFQVMQSLYNEITGKTEEIGKQYKNKYEIELSDYTQLNCKIEQALEQYNIVTSNCIVTIYYQEDNKERFSSFDRFLAFDRSKTSPTRYVHLEYNFLIALPKTKTTQSYNVSIRTGSMATHFVEWDREEMLDIVAGEDIAVAEAKVNYIDFMVAQNFKRLIDDWFESLNVATETKVVKHFKKHVKKYAYVSRMFFTLSMFFVLYFVSGKYIEFPNTHQAGNMLLQCFLIGFLLLGLINSISRIIQNLCRKSIGKILPVSYIKLNRGDDKVIESVKKINNRKLIKGLSSIGLSFAIGVCSSLLVWFLTTV